MVNFLLKTVASTYQVSVPTLVSRSKKGKLPEARRMLAFCLAHYYQLDTKKILTVMVSLKRDRSYYYRVMEQTPFEINQYKEVRNIFLNLQQHMVQYLENKIKELESWLINNPCFDGEIRQQKLDRLAETQETLEYINNLKID